MFKQRMNTSIHKTLCRLEGGLWKYTKSLYIRNLSIKFVNRTVRNRYTNFNSGVSIFRDVNITTKTGCNYSCPFCPVNKEGIEVPEGKMKKSLYQRIIDELAELKFSGSIALHINNEPLLDERLPEMVSIARNKCPEATIYISTNGAKADKKTIQNLMEAGISYIIINDYTSSNSIIKKINGMALPNHYMKRLNFCERSLEEDQTTGLCNRAGNVSWFYIPQTPLDLFCNIPFKQIYIGHDGRVSLCCMDIKFEEVMGDVSKDSLQNIWRNRKYGLIRQKLLNYDRKDIICEKCDYKGYA